MIDVLIIAIGIVVYIVCIMLARGSEKRDWNNGICKICGTKWVYFDSDSQGGRGYHCGCSNRHYTWISYDVDDVRRK